MKSFLLFVVYGVLTIMMGLSVVGAVYIGLSDKDIPATTAVVVFALAMVFVVVHERFTKKLFDDFTKDLTKVAKVNKSVKSRNEKVEEQGEQRGSVE